MLRTLHRFGLLRCREIASSGGIRRPDRCMCAVAQYKCNRQTKELNLAPLRSTVQMCIMFKHKCSGKSPGVPQHLLSTVSALICWSRTS